MTRKLVNFTIVYNLSCHVYIIVSFKLYVEFGKAKKDKQFFFYIFTISILYFFVLHEVGFNLVPMPILGIR